MGIRLKQAVKEITGKRITPVTVVLYGFLFSCGGFHEYLSAGCSLALCLLFLLRLRKNKSLHFTPNLPNVTLLCFPFLYLLVSLWAVDRGTALFGFVKFLPLSFFTLAVSDREEERDNILWWLPWAGAAQTLTGAVLMRVPALEQWFSVAGRLSGFFQYANTFGLFLMMGVLVLLTKERLRPADYVCLAVLIFGVLLSGSRTTAVLTAVFAVAAVVTGKNKRVRWTALLVLAGIVLAVGGYAVFRGDYSAAGRFLRLSLTESTFVGRLLYWKDGLRLLPAHPFGLGYLGWSYLQFSSQTGVYAVQFIHNEFLQILLDVGIPGGLLVAAAVAAAFFSKSADRGRRILLLGFCGHLLMDFDLQFVAMLLLFAALLYTPGEKRLTLSHKAAAAVPCAALTLFCLWLGIAQGLYHFKRYEASAALCPFDTPAQVALMENSGTGKKGLALADRVIKQNPYVPSAYGVKAAAAFEEGDIEAMAENKLRQIRCAPYQITVYDEYCDMLAVGFGLYKKQNDPAGMRFCREKMLEIPALLAALERKTDPLAYRIDDRPSFALSAASEAYIRQIGKVVIP